ncbi:MAG: polymer-forming cytoskeletal protein [Chloroflexi bacterium]|nr:polymer-forming cytoskeletal protein [Chloroflexota bacterium]
MGSMFGKKSEESEWTRFSRALGGAPAAPDAAPADGPAEPETMVQIPPTAPEVYQPPVAQAPPAPTIQQAPSPDPEPAAPAYTPPPAPINAPLSRMPDLERGETVIGEGASVEGAVRSDRSIRIRGNVQGEVESKQRVTVEESAQVQARISGEHVTVLGEVNGAIDCTGRLEIASSGKVTGEVTAGTLVIQEGAFFEGQLKMTGPQRD